MSSLDSFPKEYPKMLAVVAVVVDQDGRILLHQRAKEPQQGRWELLGTYVRPSEQLIDALKRELQEDAGITEIKAYKATGKYYDEPDRHPGSFCIPFAFIITVDKSQQISPSCSWFTLSEASALPPALDNNQILTDNKQYI